MTNRGLEYIPATACYKGGPQKEGLRPCTTLGQCTSVAVVLVFTTVIPGDSTNGGPPVGVATANKTQIPRCCPSTCSYLFTLSGTKFMHQGVSSSPVMVRDSRMIRDYAYGLALE